MAHRVNFNVQRYGKTVHWGFSSPFHGGQKSLRTNFIMQHWLHRFFKMRNIKTVKLFFTMGGEFPIIKIIGSRKFFFRISRPRVGAKYKFVVNSAKKFSSYNDIVPLELPRVARWKRKKVYFKKEFFSNKLKKIRSPKKIKRASYAKHAGRCALLGKKKDVANKTRRFLFLETSANAGVSSGWFSEGTHDDVANSFSRNSENYLNTGSDASLSVERNINYFLNSFIFNCVAVEYNSAAARGKDVSRGCVASQFFKIATDLAHIRDRCSGTGSMGFGKFLTSYAWILGFLKYYRAKLEQGAPAGLSFFSNCEAEVNRAVRAYVSAKASFFLAQIFMKLSGVNEEQSRFYRPRYLKTYRENGGIGGNLWHISLLRFFSFLRSLAGGLVEEKDNFSKTDYLPNLICKLFLLTRISKLKKKIKRQKYLAVKTRLEVYGENTRMASLFHLMACSEKSALSVSNNRSRKYLFLSIALTTFAFYDSHSPVAARFADETVFTLKAYNFMRRALSIASKHNSVFNKADIYLNAQFGDLNLMNRAFKEFNIFLGAIDNYKYVSAANKDFLHKKADYISRPAVQNDDILDTLQLPRPRAEEARRLVRSRFGNAKEIKVVTPLKKLLKISRGLKNASNFFRPVKKLFKPWKKKLSKDVSVFSNEPLVFNRSIVIDVKTLLSINDSLIANLNAVVNDSGYLKNDITDIQSYNETITENWRLYSFLEFFQLVLSACLDRDLAFSASKQIKDLSHDNLEKRPHLLGNSFFTNQFPFYHILRPESAKTNKDKFFVFSQSAPSDYSRYWTVAHLENFCVPFYAISSFKVKCSPTKSNIFLINKSLSDQASLSGYTNLLFLSKNAEFKNPEEIVAFEPLVTSEPSFKPIAIFSNRNLAAQDGLTPVDFNEVRAGPLTKALSLIFLKKLTHTFIKEFSEKGAAFESWTTGTKSFLQLYSGAKRDENYFFFVKKNKFLNKFPFKRPASALILTRPLEKPKVGAPLVPLLKWIWYARISAFRSSFRNQRALTLDDRANLSFFDGDFLPASRPRGHYRNYLESSAFVDYARRSALKSDGAFNADAFPDQTLLLNLTSEFYKNFGVFFTIYFFPLARVFQSDPHMQELAGSAIMFLRTFVTREGNSLIWLNEFIVIYYASLYLKSTQRLVWIMAERFKAVYSWNKPWMLMLAVMQSQDVKKFGIMGIRIGFHGKFNGKDRAYRMYHILGNNPCMRNSYLTGSYSSRQCTSLYGITHIHIWLTYI